MNKLLMPTLLALASGASMAHGDATHADAQNPYDPAKLEERAFGHEGNPKKVNRVIRLEMSDAFRFTPAEITVKRGETIRFTVRNGGQQLHEMVLGTTEELKKHAELMKKYPEMEHADANMAHVAPGASGDIVWRFTKPGEYQFGCLIPGHYEAGMVGKVVVR